MIQPTCLPTSASVRCIEKCIDRTMQSESLGGISNTKRVKTESDKCMARCVFKHHTTLQTMSPPSPRHPRCPIKSFCVWIALMMVCACMGRSQQVKEKPPADYTPKLEDVPA